MNGIEFLKLVLPPRGWYVGFATKANQRPLQQAFQTLEGLLAWTARLDKAEYTTYFACAVFRDRQVWDAKQQKFVQRTHANILCVANLWMDVDTQESHADARYVNVEEAARAVVAFCKHMGLPPPLWVSSGGGLHVHWPLAVELELGEWEVYSRGLRTAAVDFGLVIDERKTIDGSAVLRVPGTRNLKFKPPRLVEAGEAVPRYPLDRFAKLKEIGLAEPVRPKPVAQSPSSASPIAATLNRTIYDDPSDPHRAARACAQLGAFVVEPGKFSEPFQRGVAGHCKISCDGGGDIYLGWLAPEWRAAGQAKLDGWHIDDPPRCTYFESTSPYPELCKACEHYGKITAPIQLGRLAEKKIERLAQARVSGVPIQFQASNPTLQAGVPPEGTENSLAEGRLNGFPILKAPWELRDGKLLHITEDNKGNEKITLVSDHPIYIDGEYASEALGSVFCTLKHKPPNEAWCTISVPSGHLSGTASKGLAQIADGGAHVRHNGLFLEYVKEQTAEWKNRNRWGMRYEQCGLKPDLGFISGSRLYTPAGVQFVPVSDEVAIREKLGLGPRPGGSVREFMGTLNRLFKPDDYCAWLNLALSYGSVLHPLLNEYQGSLVVVNMSPHSQGGKSVILYASAAIWGLWDALSLKDQDTQPSMGLILAALGHLPGFVDEIQHFADPVHGIQRLRAFLNLFTSGIDKHRALPYGMGLRVQTNRWLNNLLTSSNTSIIDIVQAFGKAGKSDEAATNRYLELNVPRREFDQVLGPELERQLWRHAGHAGDAFLRHIVREDIQKDLIKELPQATAALWKSVSYVKEQRFRVGGLALAWTAGRALQDMGMPLTCRLDELLDWGLGQIRSRAPLLEGPEQVTDMALQALDKFMRHNANNTLRVLDAYKKNMVQHVIGARPQKVIIRVEQSTGRIYISLHEFKLYCIENGYFWTDVHRTLLEQRILLGQRKMTLGAGTEYASAQIMCLEFDSGHPVFSEALQTHTA